MTELPPPGWYPDPTAPGRERWWNGEAWTEQTQLVVSEPGFRRPGELRSVGEYLSLVFGAIRSRWREMFALVAVGAALSALLTAPLLRPVVLAVDIRENRIVGWGSEQTIRLVLAGVASTVVYLVVAGALYRNAWDAVSQSGRGWFSALKYGLRISPRLAAWMLVAFLPALAGVASVVAGISVGPALALMLMLAVGIGLLWWSLVIAMVPVGLVACPGANPIAVALIVVQGRWWPVFGRLLLVSVLSSLALQVVSAIALELFGLNLYGFEMVDVGGADFEILTAVRDPLRFFFGAFVAGLLSLASFAVSALAASSIAADVLETSASQPS